ncbi:hypothetical protein R5R35_013024 [Gryllus longicercus]|uniref:Uncharacterized protein n=1 Tax=Gryllus longicercus TaxID=2509291 RepID=A0AAN9Z2K3_9ORTH
MATIRYRLLELLQSEPSWHGHHLFAENLLWMAYMGAHTGPNPRHLSFVQMAMRTVLGGLHAFAVYIRGTMIFASVPLLGSLILMKQVVHFWNPIDTSSGKWNEHVNVRINLFNT